MCAFAQGITVRMLSAAKKGAKKSPDYISALIKHDSDPAVNCTGPDHLSVSTPNKLHHLCLQTPAGFREALYTDLVSPTTKKHTAQRQKSSDFSSIFSGASF